MEEFPQIAFTTLTVAVFLGKLVHSHFHSPSQFTVRYGGSGSLGGNRALPGNQMARPE